MRKFREGEALLSFSDVALWFRQGACVPICDYIVFALVYILLCDENIQSPCVLVNIVQGNSHKAG